MGDHGAGWLGIALFTSALIIMPILVVTYDPPATTHAAAPADTPAATSTRSSAAALAGSLAEPAASAADPMTSGLALPQSPAHSSPPQPAVAIEGFQGIGEGPLHSVVRITIDYTGALGPVYYQVTGPKIIEYVAREPPYLFDPHDPKIGGWNTAGVPDGQYTVVAMSLRDPQVQRTAQFAVHNRITLHEPVHRGSPRPDSALPPAA